MTVDAVLPMSCREAAVGEKLPAQLHALWRKRIVVGKRRRGPAGGWAREHCIQSVDTREDGQQQADNENSARHDRQKGDEAGVRGL